MINPHYSSNEQSFAPSVTLSVDNNCEFVSNKIFLDVLFYISEFRDQTKMINPHYSYKDC